MCKYTNAYFTLMSQFDILGNFGSVYVAKHVETNEVVAIKAIPLASTIHKNIVAEGELSIFFLRISLTILNSDIGNKYLAVRK